MHAVAARASALTRPVVNRVRRRVRSCICDPSRSPEHMGMSGLSRATPEWYPALRRGPAPTSAIGERPSQAARARPPSVVVRSRRGRPGVVVSWLHRAMAKATALDHLVLVVEDVERSLAWYSEHLGLSGVQVEEWRAGQVPFPSLRVDPHTIIDFIRAAAVEQGGRGHLDHICFVVSGPDLESLRQSPGARDRVRRRALRRSRRRALDLRHRPGWPDRRDPRLSELIGLQVRRRRRRCASPCPRDWRGPDVRRAARPRPDPRPAGRASDASNDTPGRHELAAGPLGEPDQRVGQGASVRGVDVGGDQWLDGLGDHLFDGPDGFRELLVPPSAAAEEEQERIVVVLHPLEVGGDAGLGLGPPVRGRGRGRGDGVEQLRGRPRRAGRGTAPASRRSAGRGRAS